MTTYQTTVKHYGDQGFIDQEVISFDLTGEREFAFLSSDKLRNQYQTLRQWAADATAESTAWAGQNAAQRDAAMATTFLRLGKLLEAMADLLSNLGKT
jgi:hypothetical protein